LSWPSPRYRRRAEAFREGSPRAPASCCFIGKGDLPTRTSTLTLPRRARGVGISRRGERLPTGETFRPTWRSPPSIQFVAVDRSSALPARCLGGKMLCLPRPGGWRGGSRTSREGVPIQGVLVQVCRGALRDLAAPP
jgi:hypothetical protein